MAALEQPAAPPGDVAVPPGALGSHADEPAAPPPGDWTTDACRAVATELVASLDLGEHREAVIDTIVWMHLATYAHGQRAERLGEQRFYASPQHLLALLNGFRAVLGTQREQLEDQQRFRLVGLERLRTAVEQVEQLQQSLGAQRTRLEQTNVEANDRLQRMVQDQQAAEEQKRSSQQVQAQLAEQEAAVAARRDAVLRDLAEAEPAVLEAQAAVSNIKKQHLSEVRSMANPPLPVKHTMESVCILLGHRLDDWKSVQQILRRDDFISAVVHLDTEAAVPRAVREQLQREYLSRPEYNYDTIQRASKACGPLASWVLAQVHFADILERVGPLRAEVSALEAEAEATKGQALETARTVEALEARIATSKSEYAALISETQAIKAEMERVQERVARSVHLLHALAAEQARWESASGAFDTEVRTLVGDALLCAAFLAYAGFFDQASREALWRAWCARLHGAQVPVRAALTPVGFLSTADERAGWQAAGLPADALATENAVILHHTTRCPFVIDPSGRIARFLEREYAPQKIAVTSFLDGGFARVLEGALRFGHPLLVQDAENFDPVLLPVLNRELRRTGGRILVRVGQQDVDYAPGFRLFLATRNPAVQITPQVFCRVAVVNFTMTRKSLARTALDALLRAERPDTEERRNALLREQNELQLRLRHLERALLAALNEAQGDLLSDSALITTLETLKAEAVDVTHRASSTGAVIAEVERVAAEYEPLAEACSGVYFALTRLPALSRFYQCDLAEFLRMFEQVLGDPALRGVEDAAERRTLLRRTLFRTAFERTAAGMLHEHHVVLAVVLAQLAQGELEGAEWDALVYRALPSGMPGAGAEAALAAYGDVPFLRLVQRHMQSHPDAWAAYRAAEAPEVALPPILAEGKADAADGAATRIRHVLIVKMLRPDRLVPALAALAASVLQVEVLERARPTHVHDQVPPTTPIALCCVSGHDASFRVEQLAAAEQRPLRAVALGSAEALDVAERVLLAAARSGEWLLLKNVHLAPAWLAHADKRVAALQPSDTFRLFLTMDRSDAVPVGFLRAARVLVHEPPAGLKAALLEALHTLQVRTACAAAGPAERERLYLLVAFLHATLAERVRYVPLGWSRPYEFHEADLHAALDVVDAWTGAPPGQAHIDPANIPWDALRVLLAQSVYGGRLDAPTDRAVLDAFVAHLFTPAAFEHGFALAPDAHMPLLAPDGTRLDQFTAWAEAFPEPQPPQWLMLAPLAERAVATARGAAALRQLALMRELAEEDALEDESAVATEGTAAAVADAGGRAGAWLQQLPTALRTAPEPPEDDPLRQFWAREHRAASELLAEVRGDLEHLVDVCAQRAKRTTRTSALLACVEHDTLPDAWRVYAVPAGTTLGAWLDEFGARLAQLGAVAGAAEPAAERVALGRMFAPGAFLTATRQAEAHRQQRSLEELEVVLHLGERQPGASGSPHGYPLAPLLLDGAEWRDSLVVPNEGTTSSVSGVLVWRQRGARHGAPGRSSVTLPVFLNSDRQQVLFQTEVSANMAQPMAVQRGIALRTC